MPDPERRRNLDLSQRTALVTGGSRGIGKEVALTFAQHGANLVLNATNKEALEETAHLAEAFGIQVITIEGDITSQNTITSLVGRGKERFGSIDTFVHAAGITADGLLIRMKDNDWDRVQNVNLRSAFQLAREITPLMMKQRRGSGIFLSSISAGGVGGQVNYAASKAGIIAVTRSLAKEYGNRGLRFNAIAPGPIDTDMTRKLNDKQKDGMLGLIALGRFGMAEEVADTALFLASDMSSYINGAVIPVDGGMY